MWWSSTQWYLGDWGMRLTLMMLLLIRFDLISLFIYFRQFFFVINAWPLYLACACVCVCVTLDIPRSSPVLFDNRRTKLHSAPGKKQVTKLKMSFTVWTTFGIWRLILYISDNLSWLIVSIDTKKWPFSIQASAWWKFLFDTLLWSRNQNHFHSRCHSMYLHIVTGQFHNLYQFSAWMFVQSLFVCF